MYSHSHPAGADCRLSARIGALDLLRMAFRQYIISSGTCRGKPWHAVALFLTEA